MVLTEEQKQYIYPAATLEGILTTDGSPNAALFSSTVFILVCGRTSHLFSKGGKQNVWPDGQYQKPNPLQIDWRKGDQELADEITGKNVPRGPGSPNNLIKKWFRDKRPK